MRGEAKALDWRLAHLRSQVRFPQFLPMSSALVLNIIPPKRWEKNNPAASRRRRTARLCSGQATERRWSLRPALKEGADLVLESFEQPEAATVFGATDHSRKEALMASLHIDLQDGFAEDLVIVWVNGIQAFRKEGVTTSLLLGYADSSQTQMPEGPANVEVIVPSRNLSKNISVRKPFLGISIREGEIDYIERGEPFGYL